MKQLPTPRLTKAQLEAIQHAIDKREDLRAHIREQLSNEALAVQLGVSLSNIERTIKFIRGIDKRE